MLSILIPVYNYSLEVLLNSLLKEVSTIHHNCEIMVLDDCSTDTNLAFKNEAFCLKNSIVYLKNDVNQGRTVTRQKIAKVAKYDYLLFLDSDTKPASENFVQNFIDQINNQDIICGGITYENDNQKKSIMLRWKYGHQRESKPFIERNKKPYLSVISACFLIKKELFLSISSSLLDNNYGMDVLFAYEMEKRNLIVEHINNPVLHLGLENNLDFIAKTEMAMDTIIRLQKANRIPKGYRPIQKKLLLLEKLKIDRLFIFCITKLKKVIFQNLNSKNPSLFLFDIYRLYCLCLRNNKL